MVIVVKYFDGNMNEVYASLGGNVSTYPAFTYDMVAAYENYARTQKGDPWAIWESFEYMRSRNPKATNEVQEKVRAVLGESLKLDTSLGRYLPRLRRVVSPSFVLNNDGEETPVIRFGKSFNCELYEIVIYRNRGERSNVVVGNLFTVYLSMPGEYGNSYTLTIDTNDTTDRPLSVGFDEVSGHLLVEVGVVGGEVSSTVRDVVSAVHMVVGDTFICEIEGDGTDLVTVSVEDLVFIGGTDSDHERIVHVKNTRQGSFRDFDISRYLEYDDGLVVFGEYSVTVKALGLGSYFYDSLVSGFSTNSFITI